MARLVLNNAKNCPFCGCEKVFLKAETSRWSEIDPITQNWSEGFRMRAAGQCAKCHIRGPFVYTELHGERPDVDEDIISRALAKWNERH